MDEPVTNWRRAARRELFELRGPERGWSYRDRGAPAVEATVLACLALLASRGAGGDDCDAGEHHDRARVTNPERAEAAVADSADWLAEIQQPDGSLGISAAQPVPGWTTPLGLLLWQALAGYETPRQRAVAWLLQRAGKPMSRAEDPDRIVGHDTTLIGWPWVENTHSWLEPTALAVLALRRAGLADHPRVLEGDRLIRDRSIAGGGWNYGNKSAFGHPLRPQPAPTGLALLALAGRGEPTPIVAEAIRHLHRTLPAVRASASLGWGLLGLRAWSSVPAEAPRWLAEAFTHATGRGDSAMKLALLLLAGGDHALELF